MNNKVDKFLSGAIGGAFDATVSLFPGINIIWSAFKGGVSNIRTKRLEEFIYYIYDIVNLNSLNNESFVDGLAITFESFLKQRSEHKRTIIKNIFLGFNKSDCKEEFELERMYDVLNRINKTQLDLFIGLKDVDKKISWQQRKGIKDYDYNYDEYKYLEFLGLVSISQNRSIEVIYDDSFFLEEEIAFVNDFGNNFIEFVLNN